MNIQLKNRGINEVEVRWFEPAKPSADSVPNGKLIYDDGVEYHILRNHRHVRKECLILKSNGEIDLPIFTTNDYWGWLMLDEVAYRGSDNKEWNLDLENQTVLIKTDSVNITTSIYRKRDFDLFADPLYAPIEKISLDGEEHFQPMGYTKHSDGVKLEVSLMNEKPPKPEDINSRVWIWMAKCYQP